MTEKKKKERARIAADGLKALYPDATCALEYGDQPWRLMVMARSFMPRDSVPPGF